MTDTRKDTWSNGKVARTGTGTAIGKVARHIFGKFARKEKNNGRIERKDT